MSAPTTSRPVAPSTAAPVPTSWAPPAAVRGTVVVLPGRGETPAHYARLGRRLSADGYAVEVLDGPAEDGGAVTAAWRALHADGRLGTSPVVAVAADASAAAVVEALATGTSAPGTGLPVSGHAGTGLAVDGVVVAGAALGGEDRGAAGERAPVDDVVAAHTACPVHRAVWAQHGDAAREALHRTTAASRRWTPGPDRVVALPALVLHGAADAIAPVGAVLDAVRAWPRARVVTVRGGVHDVLNDAAHRSVAAEVVRFLESLREAATPGRSALVVHADRLDATPAPTPAPALTSGDPL